MTAAVTLGLYISRQFTLCALGMLAALTGLTSLFDMIELLRRAATHPEATFGLVSEIEALRLPYLMLQVLPFAVLLGGMLAFWRLTRSSELIVARAAGVSAWEFLTGPVICALFLGGIATAGITPASSAMFARAEDMANRFLSSGGGPLQLAGGQLWLRQADSGLIPHGVAIIHAREVKVQHEMLAARVVTVFRLDAADRLLSRVEATRAVLRNGDWVLQDAQTVHPDGLPQSSHQERIPTDLTVDRVQESFASPDTLSVWELPGFVRLLDRSGFSSVRHRLHFEALLALPLLCATMSLVGAGFSMRPARRGGVARMIGSGVAAGFALFMISKLAEEFGQSGAMPVMLAAWAPAAAGMMLAVALLLHMEDG
jgi:lipopolysaccharide export system permease protein